jgi:hypothetical protein
MTDVELLADLVQRLAAQTRAAIDGLNRAALDWQPDPAANGIGATVWHYSRWIDLLKIRALEGRPAEDELWFANGWAERTGYDPRGDGFGGWGALTGYTMEQVRALPPLTAEELAGYLEQGATALREHLLRMAPGALHEPAAGLRDARPDLATAYDWVVVPLLGSFGHLGEVRAIKALQARAAAAARA